MSEERCNCDWNKISTLVEWWIIILTVGLILTLIQMKADREEIAKLADRVKATESRNNK